MVPARTLRHGQVRSAVAASSANRSASRPGTAARSVRAMPVMAHASEESLPRVTSGADVDVVGREALAAEDAGEVHGEAGRVGPAMSSSGLVCPSASPKRVGLETA